MVSAEHWPLFGLRIRTQRLELCIPTDGDLGELVELAKRGVHDPVTMPFVVPWTDLESPEFERSMLQYHWLTRAELSQAKWNLEFVVRSNGELVGTQSLRADDFCHQRSAESGSWLGREFQGRGIGKEMRAAIVAFAFDHLGASQITSGAFEDNFASQAVSLATGYEDVGRDEQPRRGVPSMHVRYRLTRERWLATRSADTPVVEGFEPCRSMLGLGDAAAHSGSAPLCSDD